MTKNEMRRERTRLAYIRVKKLLCDKGYSFHHVSLARGYYRIDDLTISEYKGRFGNGFAVESHAENNNFHYIEYYVK